jgi:hypothetical protein
VPGVAEWGWREWGAGRRGWRGEGELRRGAWRRAGTRSRAMVWLALGRGAGVRSVGSGICRGIGLRGSEAIVVAWEVGYAWLAMGWPRTCEASGGCWAWS